MNCSQCKKWNRPDSTCRDKSPSVQVVGVTPDEQNNPRPLSITLWPQVKPHEWCNQFEADLRV